MAAKEYMQNKIPSAVVAVPNYLPSVAGLRPQMDWARSEAAKAAAKVKETMESDDTKAAVAKVAAFAKAEEAKVAALAGEAKVAAAAAKDRVLDSVTGRAAAAKAEAVKERVLDSDAGRAATFAAAKAEVAAAKAVADGKVKAGEVKEQIAVRHDQMVESTVTPILNKVGERLLDGMIPPYAPQPVKAVLGRAHEALWPEIVNEIREEFLEEVSGLGAVEYGALLLPLVAHHTPSSLAAHRPARRSADGVTPARTARVSP